MNIVHTHTMYSLNRSAMTPKELVLKAKDLGCQSVAITDFGTLLGVESFMDAGKEIGINTVPGIEFSLDNDSTIIIIAKNYKGYTDISHALKEANFNIKSVKIDTTNTIEYPVLSMDVLEKYFKQNPDVIALTSSIGGVLCHELLKNFTIKNNNKEYEEFCNSHKELYDKVNSYKNESASLKVEISDIKKIIREYKKHLSQETEIKIEKLKGVITASDKETKKYQNAIVKLDDLNMKVKEAQEMLPDCENRLEILEKKSEKIKSFIKESKKDYDKYVRFKCKLDDIVYESEDVIYDNARALLYDLKDLFKNLFVEITYRGMEEETYCVPLLINLCNECDVSYIITNEIYMADKSDASCEARRILKYNISSESQELSDYELEEYIKTENELSVSLNSIINTSYINAGFDNLSILDECKVEFDHTEHHPAVKMDKTIDELIDEEKKIWIKNGDWDEAHEERLQHELKVIKKMGYVDYHLVVKDICDIGKKMGVVPQNAVEFVPSFDFNIVDRWIKKNHYNVGVGIGPGRGSAVGSLVCRMLHITNIDPLKYDLLFERFLNPERVSMPDIDTDVSSSIRPLVIKYLKWRYGEDAVCSIATELLYGAKNAIQMAGRERAAQLFDKTEDKDSKIREYRNNITLKISDAVPDEPGISLADCDEDFKANLDMSNPEINTVIERAKLIEGKIYGTGVHAGGVVISDNDNINDYLPLAWNEEKQVWAAQCNMIKVEEKGLLKMDILGVSTLDCISDCIQMIQKYKNISIDINKIEFEEEVFKFIYSTGLTNSVFQFESGGMKNMLKEFKPTCFEDLIILVACYRPGPMQYLEDIIAIKNGKKRVSYKHQMLEPILSKTYGATVYQEQVMQIFQTLAGYSLGGADLVRRAMSKKKTEKLEIERTAFIYGDAERNIEGCVARGISKEIANELFDEMMEFAKYAFNKSHATAYALVSYQTAWLKYHYPVYYLCSMFNNKPQDKYEPIIEDCNNFNIKLLPIDINSSYYDFVVEGNAIRYGFKGIKGIGEGLKSEIERFCDNRNERKYSNFRDFLIRNIVIGEKKSGLTYSIIKQNLLLNMIYVGAFDCFTKDRYELASYFTEDGKPKKIDSFNSLDNANRWVQSIKINSDLMDINYNFRHEYELMGTIVSGKPLDDYKNDSYYGCTEISSIKEDGNYNIFGMIVSSVERKSKKGNNLLILQIQGKRGNCTVIAMNKLYNEYKGAGSLFKVVKINASYSNNGFFANSISILNSMNYKYNLCLKSEEDTERAMRIINNKTDDVSDISLTVLCHWVGREKLHKVERPKIAELQISQKQVEMLRKEGLEIKTI